MMSLLDTGAGECHSGSIKHLVCGASWDYSIFNIIQTESLTALVTLRCASQQLGTLTCIHQALPVSRGVQPLSTTSSADRQEMGHDDSG